MCKRHKNLLTLNEQFAIVYLGLENMKNNTTKLLKGLFSLDHNIRIYVPSTVNVNTEIDTNKYVETGLSLFSQLFGGSTAFQAMGAWQSQVEGLVTEKVTIVESYATREQIEAGLEKVLEFGKTMKNELKQEAISLEYDNKLYFI